MHRDGFKEVDLGIPTYGEVKSLHDEIYGKLRSDGEILENIAPLVLREKYLANKDCVLTEQLCQSLFRTSGETRPATRAVLEQSIINGVNLGLFGLGELQEEKPFCRLYKETSFPAFSGQEILIAEALCKKQEKPETQGPPKINEPPATESSEEEPPVEQPVSKKNEVHLRFKVPKGKVSNIMGVMNYLQSRFDTLELELIAKEGGITQQEYEDKIEEAFSQLGIDVDEE